MDSFVFNADLLFNVQATREHVSMCKRKVPLFTSLLPQALLWWSWRGDIDGINLCSAKLCCASCFIYGLVLGSFLFNSGELPLYVLYFGTVWLMLSGIYITIIYIYFCWKKEEEKNMKTEQQHVEAASLQSYTTCSLVFHILWSSHMGQQHTKGWSKTDPKLNSKFAHTLSLLQQGFKYRTNK